MKIKQIICLSLCLTMLLCTACRKNNTELSSNTSSTSAPIPSFNESDTSSISSSLTESITSSKVDNSTSNTQSTTSIDFERMYGLKSLESVGYTCYKDIPNGEAQYEITEVLNDKGQDLKISCDYSFDSKDIKIDGLIVTVPAKYKATHKSVKGTVTHRLSGITLDFELKFASNYKLIFEDNFDGNTLNTNVWYDVWDTGLEHEVRDEYSYGYVKENAFLDGEGHLINRVKALPEKNKYGKPIYTSSQIGRAHV